MEELQKELDKRVALMREGSGGDGVTDQGRVYDYIVGALERGEWLRLMVQASYVITYGRLRTKKDQKRP